LLKHPESSKTVHFPFDPRLAVPFFYSTVPGPLFLSWACFFSPSPFRFVSFLASAAPRPWSPTRLDLQVQLAPLSVPSQSTTLSPHDCPPTQSMATLPGQLKYHRGSIRPPSSSWYGYLETLLESQHGGNT
ncbi:hypothetical protein CORC01_08269, partial [Colletotrichum orchidophilum]